MSTGFVCVQPNGSGCDEWAQAWALSSLPVDDALLILTAAVACFGIAWGARLLVSFLLNR